MDDKEARYLIDQFNKHCSWGGRIEEIQLIFVTSLIAVIAVFVGSFNILAQLQIQIALVLLKSPNQQVVTTAISGMADLAQKAVTFVDVTEKTAGLALAGIIVISVTIYLRRWGLSKRLTMLEDYRSKYRSLPDTKTFSKIINFRKFKTADLQKLLKQGEQEIARHGRL